MTRKIILLASVVPIVFAFAQPASAQSDAPAAGEVEALIVTGRGQPRSVQNSPVPVDVFSAEELTKVAQIDTLNTLKTLIPSYSVPRSANSTSDTFVRSPSLRGLAADKTLLLMNSRRRHKSGSVGVGGTGSQTADAAVIPSLALKSVEVLRDGAAAQYGSDAIAGVINFILKDSSSGGAFVVQGGQYYEGDGRDVLVAGNIGLPLTDRGFINLTGQWTQGDNTIRSQQFVAPQWNAVAQAAANPAYASVVNLDEPLQRSGRPKEIAWRSVVNAGFDISDTSSLYAYGNYSKSRGTAFGNYRYPGGGHPVMDIPVRLQDGSIFAFKNIHSAGLRPAFSGRVTDWSAAGGYRTEMMFDDGRELTADVGIRYGYSKIGYSIVDTVNPSMGPQSPLNFKASSYISDEFAVNADFGYSVPTSFTSTPVVISFGAETRNEGFEITPGEPDSYRVGTWANPDPFDFCTNETAVASRTLRASAPQNRGINCALSTDPVYRVLSVGSNGITGLAPANSGEWTSKSYSLYGEISSDITDKLFLDLAVRFEDYEAFGSEVIGKLAGRFAITPDYGIRASVGTGFRAPTAGQLNMTQIQINTIDGVPTNTGLYPATAPVPVFLGSKPLEPESSFNYSVGLTASPLPRLQLTIDYYSIEVNDQLYSTAQIPVTAAVRAQMIAAGIPGGDSITSVNFFQNAFDSKVSGIDIVGSYRLMWENGQSTSMVASFNRNKYEIGQVHIAGLFNDRVIYNFERSNPKYRASFSATHEAGPLTFMARANVFGPLSRQSTTTPFPTQNYHAEVMVDAEITYEVREGVAFSIGANNLFDNYPERNTITSNNGLIYADGAVDWQGGYYYAKFAYNF